MSERQYPSDIIRVGATRTPLFDFRPSRFPLLLFWFSFFYPSVPHAAITDENAKIFPNIFYISELVKHKELTWNLNSFYKKKHTEIELFFMDQME